MTMTINTVRRHGVVSANIAFSIYSQVDVSILTSVNQHVLKRDQFIIIPDCLEKQEEALSNASCHAMKGGINKHKEAKMDSSIMVILGSSIPGNGTVYLLPAVGKR